MYPFSHPNKILIKSIMNIYVWMYNKIQNIEQNVFACDMSCAKNIDISVGQYYTTYLRPQFKH